ncbi:amino acid deaminase [Vibrio sp. T187]|uniref:amino acid deaminase n=1 Tax=Vibrio TaxID=662 RepID=UPI0010C984BD|nr:MULTISPECIES: amino acid deaminase [Vibrio]MBW3695874.1 amino acid deaminase [Vibrio sp. T187]
MNQEKQSYDSNFHTCSSQSLPIGTKGLPICRSSSGVFSLTQEEISLPCAVVRKSAIENNIDWMQSFASKNNVKLCPHGKTTMTPALFKQQLDNGAWGITVASAVQAEVAVLAGAKKVIIANQVVGKVNMQIVTNLIKQHNVTIYSCVDNKSNVQAWNKVAAEAEINVPLFIELGVQGGRCGCRTAEDVHSIAKTIVDASHVELSGIELYEGVIGGDNVEQNIREFLKFAIGLLRELKAEHHLAQAIISGAGSAWYDIVADEFSQLDDLTGIIRPGCYAIHDTGIYQDAQNLVQDRAQAVNGIACDLSGDLVSSLEVWAYVISVPESGKAVVGLGKRDVAFDAGLPIIERIIRDGEEITPEALTCTNVMDQHMFVETPKDNLKVGDVLVMSTSHPCLTFDKWRYIGVVDEQDNVTHWMPTFF